MKILLTGCAGFIGSHLAEKLLEQNHTIIGIDDFDNFYNPEFKWENLTYIFENYARNFYLIKDNIFNVQYDKLDFDVVVHLAAVPGVRNSISDPLNTLVNNVDATAILLQKTAMRAQKFIFASSSSVYGNNRVPFSVEDRVDHPISPYAASKKQVNYYVIGACQENLVGLPPRMNWQNNFKNHLTNSKYDSILY